MNTKRVLINLTLSIAAVEAMLVVAVRHGLTPSAELFVVGFLVCCLVVLFGEIPIRGRREGGWLVYFLLLFSLYVILTPAEGASPSAYVRSVFSSVLSHSKALEDVAERGHDAYLLLGTAAFTLVALFFIAVKKITIVNAARLLSIAEAFALTFLICVPALILADVPWWRLGVMFVFNIFVMILFARQPAPYLVNVSVDSAGEAEFWQQWVDQRRAYSMFLFFAFCVVALFPQFGEAVLVLTLGSILYGAARSATFLFISSEMTTPRSVQADQILRLLFFIKVRPDFEKAVANARVNRLGLWFQKSPASRHVLFRFANVPTATNCRVQFTVGKQEDTPS